MYNKVNNVRGHTNLNRVLDGVVHLRVVPCHLDGTPMLPGSLSYPPNEVFYGIRDFARFDRRTPTAAFRLAGHSPQEVAEHLAQRGVYVWSGNFYALAVTERLGLEATGGVVRAGLAHYNTREEVDYCLACLREMV